jgi:hypothetical protein
MPTGRPSKWVTAKVVEPIELGTRGLELVIWEKWGKRRRRGTAVVSVGGIRWYPYKAKKPYRISWDHLTKHATNGAS